MSTNKLVGGGTIKKQVRLEPDVIGRLSQVNDEVRSLLLYALFVAFFMLLYVALSGQPHEFGLMSKATGSLIVYSTPQDAYLYVDGRYRGQAEGIFQIPHGSHEIRIYKRGFKPFEAQLILEENDLHAVSATLDPLKTR
ncbi:MAG: PEGA domain-containing protein [Candidatus Altiarchaeales archaeon]|nr:PEGA domain-containing protein [Candidatus Altiarchaeales archaeon]